MGKKQKTILLLVALLVLLIGAGFAYRLLSDKMTPMETPAAPSEQEKMLAPDFTVMDSEGTEVLLSDLKGKPVILNCWATWCGYCKDEMPYFEEAYAEYGDTVSFMMVDMVDGSRETEEIGKEYIEEMGYSFPVYFDSSREVSSLYGVSSLPTTFFIDKDGYLVTGAKGALTKELLWKGIGMITSEEVPVTESAQP